MGTLEMGTLEMWTEPLLKYNILSKDLYVLIVAVYMYIDEENPKILILQCKMCRRHTFLFGTEEFFKQIFKICKTSLFDVEMLNSEHTFVSSIVKVEEKCPQNIDFINKNNRFGHFDYFAKYGLFHKNGQIWKSAIKSIIISIIITLNCLYFVFLKV